MCSYICVCMGYRVHVEGRDEIDGVSLSAGVLYTATLQVMVNRVKGVGGWACTSHPHQTGLIFPSWWSVRHKLAFATLCVL
jgi:hypothetical protein